MEFSAQERQTLFHWATSPILISPSYCWIVRYMKLNWLYSLLGLSQQSTAVGVGCWRIEICFLTVLKIKIQNKSCEVVIFFFFLVWGLFSWLTDACLSSVFVTQPSLCVCLGSNIPDVRTLVVLEESSPNDLISNKLLFKGPTAKCHLLRY